MTTAMGTAVELHDGLDEGEWLATRRGVITATAASACAGSQPYYSIVQLWEEQTNPEWDAESARNRWLDMYAANGHVAEPRIIEWAGQALGVTFTPSHALVGRLRDIEAGLSEPAAATPDGINYSLGELIEAKTAQKDWAPPPEGWDGDVWIVHADDDWKTDVPQHVQDQCEWQLHVTSLLTVWIAVEVTKWTGRGTNKVPTVVGRRVIEYRSNPARRAFLIERVEWFRYLKAEGIAPESEVDLRTIDAAGIDPFADDDDPVLSGVAARVALDRIAELDEALKPLQEERDRLSAEVKAYVTGLEGRRVDAVASKYTARLIRSFQSKTNTAALTTAERRRITTWSERETMTIVPTEQEETNA